MIRVLLPPRVLGLGLADFQQVIRLRVHFIHAVHVEIACVHVVDQQFVEIGVLEFVGVAAGMLCSQLYESSAIGEIRAGFYLVIMSMHDIPGGWLKEQHDGGWAVLAGGFHSGLL